MPELSKEALLVRCAYFHYREKLNIQDVANRLGISRFRVSRYLKEAEERGIVEIRINDSALHYEKLAMELESRYNIQKVLVVPVTRDMDSESVRKVVGHRGAELFWSADSELSIGITWGRTIAHMVEHLPANQLKASRITELTGGLGMINAELPTSALASLFAKKTEAPCFQMSGPIIASSASIASTFLEDASLARTLDMAKNSDVAICGIATLNVNSMLFHAGLLNEEDFKKLEALGAVGSIVGRFFDAQGKEVESPYKGRSISISWDNYLKIPERIILAGGWNKLGCVQGILNGGLATTLVLDNFTASSLVETEKE